MLAKVTKLFVLGNSGMYKQLHCGSYTCALWWLLSSDWTTQNSISLLQRYTQPQYDKNSPSSIVVYKGYQYFSVTEYFIGWLTSSFGN